MTPSNRTLEVGSVQCMILEQSPVADDPLSQYLDGMRSKVLLCDLATDSRAIISTLHRTG